MLLCFGILIPLVACTKNESTDACVGATAKLGIKQSGKTMALAITKKTADTLVIMYRG